MVPGSIPGPGISPHIIIIQCLIIFEGKAREKLKWADGKMLKSEMDIQVLYGQNRYFQIFPFDR